MSSNIAGQDYSPVWINLTFNASNTEQNITVHIIDDLIPEPDESFYIVVDSSDPEICVGGRHARVTIIDDGEKGIPIAACIWWFYDKQNFSPPQRIAMICPVMKTLTALKTTDPTISSVYVVQGSWEMDLLAVSILPSHL